MNLEKLIEDNGFRIDYENVTDIEDNDTFVEIRRRGFGASESSILLGVNPFDNIETLIHNKNIGYNDPEIQEKPAVKMGHDLEPFIIDKMNEVFKDFEEMSTIIKPKHMYKDDETGLTVNFDGVVEYKGQVVPFEIKTISYWGAKYYNFNMAADVIMDPEYIRMMEPSNENVEQNYIEDRRLDENIKLAAEQTGIPAYYYTQIQQQMYFLDSNIGFLLALNSKTWDYYLFKIERDDNVIEALKESSKHYYPRLQDDDEI